MLVAYGPEGHPVVAEERCEEQLQQLSRDRLLYCPNCRGILHVRGGSEKRTHLHFDHQRGECAWSTEGESLRHAHGERVLAHWHGELFSAAAVRPEERLPEPNRIADVYVEHVDGQRWAVEFQCAPLDIAEWRMRHEAYRKAGILDTWIVGTNRREKQEAFIEAIVTTAHEVLFLDPQIQPPRIWLRWPLPRQQAQEWQTSKPLVTHGRFQPELGAWIGRSGYGAMLTGSLHELHITEQVRFIHPTREAMQQRSRLLATMNSATSPDETTLASYLRQIQQVSSGAINIVFIPLLRAYLRDPDLLRRYNYGRGLPDQPCNPADQERITKARLWILALAQRGFSLSLLQELVQA